MRKRTLVTVLVGVGVGLGWLLSQLFPDLGADGIGLGKPLVTTAPPDEPPAEPEPTPTDPETGAPVSEPVVYVLLDGRDFFIRTTGGETPEYRPASLAEVLAAAQSATGNEDGLRIRIARKQTARATTEQQLRTALQQAGFHPDVIRWDEDPVP